VAAEIHNIGQKQHSVQCHVDGFRTTLRCDAALNLRILGHLQRAMANSEAEVVRTNRGLSSVILFLLFVYVLVAFLKLDILSIL